MACRMAYISVWNRPLAPEQISRLVSAETLAVRWLETRLPEEIEVWTRAVAVARSTIAEAFSAEVITPGVTTINDVSWYIRERFEQLGLRPWFQPYVNIQRRGKIYEPENPFFGISDATEVIRRGDMLHTGRRNLLPAVVYGYSGNGLRPATRRKPAPCRHRSRTGGGKSMAGPAYGFLQNRAQRE